jgi:aldehyde:ferredoxin oxidoreductase
MSSQQSSVYPDKMIRIDLTSKKITEQVFDQEIMKKYIGGTGIGARILYDEVHPPVLWVEPGWQGREHSPWSPKAALPTEEPPLKPTVIWALSSDSTDCSAWYSTGLQNIGSIYIFMTERLN